MEKAFLLCSAIGGIVLGVLSAHASIIYVQKEVPNFSAPTSPPAIRLFGTIVSVNTAAHVIELQVISPYYPSGLIQMRVKYNDTTAVRTAESGGAWEAAGTTAQLDAQFPTGTRGALSASRKPGPLYMYGLSKSISQ